MLHTSVQKRAIRTADLALRRDATGSWLPVRRSWRLNERHYGALPGHDKKETTAQYGADQVKIWRRSLRRAAAAARRRDDPPTPTRRPALRRPARRRAPGVGVPRRRGGRGCSPYWYDAIVPDLRAGETVLVAAHGNSLRALVKHLDGISDDDIAELNIPTGVPLRVRARRALAPMDNGRSGPLTSTATQCTRRPKPSPDKQVDHGLITPTTTTRSRSRAVRSI